jgi:excisionase family DNA binding protein
MRSIALREALRLAAQAQRATADALEALADLVTSAPSAPAPPASDDPEALLSVPRAAKRIGMSASWVYRAVEEGRLPCVRIGSRVRVRAGDLEAFVRDRESIPRDALRLL